MHKKELLEEINLDFKTINYFMTVNLQSKVFKKKIHQFLIDISIFVSCQIIIKKKYKALEGKGFILKI